MALLQLYAHRNWGRDTDAERPRILHYGKFKMVRYDTIIRINFQEVENCFHVRQHVRHINHIVIQPGFDFISQGNTENLHQLTHLHVDLDLRGLQSKGPTILILENWHYILENGNCQCSLLYKRQSFRIASDRRGEELHNRYMKYKPFE